MKKLFLSALLSVGCFVLSSHAMKRESSSDEPVAKKVRFIDTAEEKKYTAEELDQIVQKAIKADDKREDALYHKRFYYIRGVSRKLADKYRYKLMALEEGFNYASGDCEDYENGYFHTDGTQGKEELFKTNMKSIRPFVLRYAKTVIKKALSLRSANLKDDEIGDECERAIELIHSEKKLLSYILKGRRNCNATKEQLQEKWQAIIEMSLMHQAIAVALTASVSE